jgi:hypothetical protein
MDGTPEFCIPVWWGAKPGHLQFSKDPDPATPYQGAISLVTTVLGALTTHLANFSLDYDMDTDGATVDFHDGADWFPAGKLTMRSRPKPPPSGWDDDPFDLGRAVL